MVKNETPDHNQATEVAMEEMQVKRLVLIMALVALAASAATGPYTLVLITQGRYFKSQLGTFESLRDCKIEGTAMVLEHDLYIGFGCVTDADRAAEGS